MPIHNTSRCIVTHFSILSLHNNQTTFSLFGSNQHTIYYAYTEYM